MTDIQWNKPSMLATPGAPLQLRLDDGRIVEGVRPGYIGNATKDEVVFHDRCGNKLNGVTGWIYQAWSTTKNGDKYDD